MVARTRRLAGTRKVGHAGTLDPMATGLLVLGVNTRPDCCTTSSASTRSTSRRSGSAGRRRPTTPRASRCRRHRQRASAAVDDAAVAAAIAPLTGEIEQVPERRQRHQGRRQARLPARARGRGSSSQLARVTVSAFEVLACARGDGCIDLDVRVECSSGTYIRALARDLGAVLGVGGHLTALRRTRIGPFDVAEARARGLDVAAALIRPADAARRAFPSRRHRAAGRRPRPRQAHRRRPPAERRCRRRCPSPGHRRDGARRPPRRRRRAAWRRARRSSTGFPTERPAHDRVVHAGCRSPSPCRAGLLCLVLGLAAECPTTSTLGALALVELLLIVQLVIAIVAPAFGNAPTGSVLEFYVYLVSALLLPPAAVFWALLERTAGARSSSASRRSRSRSWSTACARSGSCRRPDRV